MDTTLDALEARSIYIMREAYNRLNPLGMLWSMGKDSTALLWMVRKSFFGRVPFPLTLLDTGMELPEVYDFKDFLQQEWDLDLRVEDCPPESQCDPSLPPDSRAAARKTAGLRNVLQREKYKGLIVGIRRDEQAIRAKERVFSIRAADGAWDFKNQPAELWDQFSADLPPETHMRVHPLLHWSELDIWRYIARENIPIVPLYFARNGMRYRSLGEKNITKPVPSNATTIEAVIAELQDTKISERAGRTMDAESEDSFERLRAQGYM